jgi:hypothetical protein
MPLFGRIPPIPGPLGLRFHQSLPVILLQPAGNPASHGIPLLPFRIILYLILYRIATVVALQVAAKALGILKSAAGVLCSDSSLPP